MTLNKFLILVACYTLAFNFSGCNENTEQADNSIKESILKKQEFDDKSLPFNERIRQFVERRLQIDVNEKYRLKVYEAYLNNDSKLDVVVTVNRLEHAYKKAEEENRVSKSETMGYFGSYNYVFYYSSIKDEFSKPIAIISTPQRELKVSFENISSTQHQDILIDYAIRNSQFRKVFLMFNDNPSYTFQWKLYDAWGTDDLEAYCFQFEKGSYSAVKDIVINQAIMQNIKPDENYNTITPQIECTDKLVKRFFYNPKDGKYYTPN